MMIIPLQLKKLRSIKDPKFKVNDSVKINK